MTGNLKEITIDKKEEEDRCLKQSDIYLKRTYWYYLRGAPIISQRRVVTKEREYQILTYVNIVGTFLVVASCKGDEITANTFVRLGRGGVPTEAPELI